MIQFSEGSLCECGHTKSDHGDWSGVCFADCKCLSFRPAPPAQAACSDESLCGTCRVCLARKDADEYADAIMEARAKVPEVDSEREELSVNLHELRESYGDRCDELQEVSRERDTLRAQLAATQAEVERLNAGHIESEKQLAARFDELATLREERDLLIDGLEKWNRTYRETDCEYDDCEAAARYADEVLVKAKALAALKPEVKLR